MNASDIQTPVFQHLRQTVTPYIASCKMPGGVGRYRYSTAVEQETLYSSAYAAMTLSLLGELDAFGADDKKAWADYLNNFQDDDGLFRDPVIFGKGWYECDPLWCGRAHLSCHVVTALACLGHKAAKQFSFLDNYKDIKKLGSWLSGLDFGENVAYSGNEIMNIGTLLQYARDIHADRPSGEAVDYLLEWLSSQHINPETGVWGDLDITKAVSRSTMVQAAYHWWPLFFYDCRPVPNMEAAVDTVLLTQNASGGFGWGIHNPDASFNSSACEDIDSIDPLVRMTCLTAYREKDIADALMRARGHVLSNQMIDGGFVFYKGREFQYGHEQLHGTADKGAMFPTWFRTLSIALIDTFFHEVNHMTSPYTFTDIPGFQFWER
jgi:hypothetical protein